MRGALSFPANINLAWLQSGYDNPKLFDQTFPDRLRVTKVGLQIGSLAHFIQQGNAQKVTPIAAGLREMLREI